jgi:hypothetical protein
MRKADLGRFDDIGAAFGTIRPFTQHLGEPSGPTDRDAARAIMAEETEAKGART